MSSYQKFAKNFGIIGLANLFVAIEGIIFLPIITKILGAISYGIWSQLGVTVSLLTPIVLLGLPGALVRFLAAEKDKREIQEGFYSVLTLIFVFALTVALFLTIFSQSIANFFQCSSVLIKILALIVLFQCLNLTLLSFFQTFQKIRKYAVFLILQVSSEIGLVVASVFLGYGLFGAVLSLLAIRLLIFLSLFILILKKIGFRIPVFSKIKNYLSFSLPTVLSSVSYWLVTSSDRYLIGFFLGVLFVGYYTPAYSIGNILTFFIYPFAFMLPPALSKLFEEGKTDEVRIYLNYSLKYFLVIAIPATFGLSILSKQILTIFSTKEIAANSYFITPFVVLSILLYGIYIIFVQILSILKKTKIFGVIWLIAALLNIVLNIVLIPFFGILAAALTTLLSYSFALLLVYYYSSKDFQFEIDWQFVVKSILASILMSLFIVWFNPLGLLKTILAIIFGVLIYGVIIFLLKCFNKEEIEFIKSFL